MANCAPSTVGFASGGGKPLLKNRVRRMTTNGQDDCC
jgi:hypothetical protein